MASSLAEQLAKGASVNANILNERSRKQATSESYLFSPKEARQHDLDSLRALGVNGFLQLVSLQPALAEFEDPLFSDEAKTLDRTLRTSEQNAELDATLSAFLPGLGPFLLDAPTGKVLEWLVRRFRIHEFNVPSVVALFLPYHETPHFTKMVSILRIPDNSPLRFIQAYKTNITTMHRPLLINDMLTTPDVTRFVAEILPTVLKEHSTGVHRALIAFHTGTLLEFVAKCKTVDENVMTVLLPAAMEPLQSESPIKRALLQETILGSFLVLAAISQKARLTPKAVKSILTAVVGCAERVSPKQLIRTLVGICAPQDQLEKLPSSLVKALLTVPYVERELVGAMAWVGSEKVLNPLMESLVSRVEEPAAESVLETVLTAPELLASVACSIAISLFSHLIENETAEQSALAWRRLLSQLHQRQPKSVQSASEIIVQKDENTREAIEQLTLSISVPVSGTSVADAETATLFVGATNADANVRAKAVRDLISHISAGNVAEDEMESIASTLVLRVHDSSAPVLQALYGTSPEPVVRVFLSSCDPSAYLDALQQTLHFKSAKPSRDVVRTHLTFLLTHFVPAATAAPSTEGQDEPGEESEENRERMRRITMDILFPFLLYSKPRMKTAQAIWEILGAVDGTGSEGVSFELLGGCVDAVKWEQAKNKGSDADKEVELLTKVNIAVAAKIADNILASNYFKANFDRLLETLRDENPHARSLGYLVVRALLNRLSGEQRIESGHSVLQAMKLDALEGMGDFMRGVVDVGLFLDDTSVGTAVVLKPSSQNTLHRLQLAVLSVLPNFPRPAGVSLEWIAEYPPSIDTSGGADARAARYIQLLRAVYCLSNSSASLPLLSTHLLRLLFVNLGDDALAFLAGVWLTVLESDESAVHIQYAALRHACAFLEAHVATQRTVDFQTVLPALLVMLLSADASVREAAIRCLAVVIKLSFSNEAEGVYAFDAIYGKRSAVLQYLDWADLQKYMKAIAENRENLTHDPEYLHTFHREHLAVVKGESKKTAGYKQRVLCYLLSHVDGCPLVSVKNRLLRSLDTVSSDAKVQVLLPTIENLLGTPEVQDSASRRSYQDLAAFAVSVFDASAAVELNDTDKSLWGVYEKSLTTCLKTSGWAQARDALLYRLQHGLFARLSPERKLQLCSLLLRVGAEDESVASTCKQILGSVLSDFTLIVRLLVLLQPQASLDAVAQPAAKRPRVEKTASSAASGELASLAMLTEVVGSLKFTGTLELVACLLETLNKVTINISPDVADRRFVEQLLMSAIENAVENLPPTTVVAPGSIRVDTLVEILRTSENPQTFHQACLLMASLARIAPDAVLHNVMPVFTFMGSNIFHRDDTYSFRVVQKTIDTIVPVTVSSLKEIHGSGVALYQASRDFLRVFTNAANHIPRHRRVNFFSHLVDTLGPADFLAPTTMLLVDRVSNKVVRQLAADSAGSLFLPLAVYERYAAETQLSSFIEIAREVQRLTAKEDKSGPPFLKEVGDDEQAHAELAAKRRAAALLVFCDHALKRLRTTAIQHSAEERTTSQALLALFLASSTAKPNDEAYAELAAAARSAMASTLGIMSAPDFVAGISTILESGTILVQSGALDLLAERLTEVAEHARCELASSIVKIIDAIKTILGAPTEPTLARAALQALAAIADTLSSGEEGAIASSVPLVLHCAGQQNLRVTAFRSLLAYSSKLGPRTIPYLKAIVKACVSSSRDVITGNSDDAEVLRTASGALRNLLTAIPTFWGETEILSVIELYLEGSRPSTGEAAELLSLVKTTAKRASPNVLLPALFKMWSRSLSGMAKERSDKTVAYIQVLRHAIKFASRPAVLENLRELFKSFLSMFDSCAVLGDDEFERTLIGTFTEVVVKLNETAFRPMFRKMFDWAFAGESIESNSRQIVFCDVYSHLLEFFKALMVPYMSFVWPAFVEHLRNCASDVPEDGRVWSAILRTLSKSMSSDEDRVFWRSDKLQQLVPVAVQQLPVAAHVELPEAKAALSDCLLSLMSLVDDDVLAKSLNLDVLMHSRSEDARVRLLSLVCAEQLWRAHGDKLLGFVPETATFIAEGAEDENDRVVQQAHKLKAAVESIGGNVDVS